MHRKLVIFLPILSLFVTTAWSNSSYTNVSVLDAKAMIDSDPSLVVLDVRTQSEYDEGHIGNARLIPHTELEGRLGELNSTDAILVYCGTGGRSATASQILVENGFLHVFNMLEGITGWIDAGYPVYVKYSSIQEAINSAAQGDTIFVSSGLYFEHLTVNKSLALVGENIYTTTIDGNDSGTVVQVKADNFLIGGFTIQRSGCSCLGYSGVYVEGYHSNVTVTHNFLTQNGYGVKVDWSNNTVIANNNIIDNYFGINTLYSSNISIFWNAITNNTAGIVLTNSNNNTVTSNIVLNNDIGVYLSLSSGNTISGNTIASSNSTGIILEQSSGNVVIHCNFVDNLEQVDSYEQANVWDDGLEGDYWSNYTGVDLDYDGIGDTGHVIDASNTDNYPLMGMFSDFQATSEHHIQTICNSTISDFQFNGTAASFDVSGEDGAIGFCRVLIPTALMNTTYKVFVNSTEISYSLLPFSNETHSYLYFNYTHSTQEVIIIPEFPSFLILPLFMIATLLAVIVYRRKLS